MPANLPALRIEADALAKRLPRLSAKTSASDAAHLGSAGRRRAGTGEDFWEYRRYNTEDDASRVDWRRSARGDALFVRETELETARSLYFWVDPHAGFDWAGETSRTSKADRARVLAMAMANLLSREGERVGLLGSLAISDPVEIEFPFKGRVRLSRPGTVLERILGRAETVQTEYAEKYAENRAALTALAARLGWRLISHSTGDEALMAGAQLHETLSQLGERA